jgi:hypothetical protein
MRASVAVDVQDASIRELHDAVMHRRARRRPRGERLAARYQAAYGTEGASCALGSPFSVRFHPCPDPAARRGPAERDGVRVKLAAMQPQPRPLHARGRPHRVRLRRLRGRGGLPEQHRRGSLRDGLLRRPLLRSGVCAYACHRRGRGLCGLSGRPDRRRRRALLPGDRRRQLPRSLQRFFGLQ